MKNYKQNDDNWKYYPYAGEYMCNAGCGPTAVADLVEESPVIIADWMTANGYASNGSGTYHEGIYMALRANKFTSSKITSGSKAGVMSCDEFEQAKKSVQDGNCAIWLMGGLKSGCINSYWSNSGHYIAIVGYDASTDRYLVYDPIHYGRDGWHKFEDFAGCIKHVFITNVKWNESVSPTTPSTTYTKTLPQLKKGDCGTIVTFLEALLRARGYYKGKLDGMFGPALKEAVGAFQKDAGLVVDYIFGPKSWTKLLGIISGTVDGTNYIVQLPQVYIGRVGVHTLIVQEVLTALGLYSLGLDRMAGKGTVEGIKAFERMFGLEQDGIWGIKCWSQAFKLKFEEEVTK